MQRRTFLGLATLSGGALLGGFAWRAAQAPASLPPLLQQPSLPAVAHEATATRVLWHDLRLGIDPNGQLVRLEEAGSTAPLLNDAQPSWVTSLTTVGGALLATDASQGTLRVWRGPTEEGTPWTDGMLRANTLAVTSDAVWCADRGNRVLLQFSHDGTLVRSWDGASHAELGRISAMAALPDGSLMVADVERRRLHHLRADGSIAWTSERNAFRFASGLVVTADGLLLADSDRLRQWTLQGEPTGEVLLRDASGLPVSPRALFIDPVTAMPTLEVDRPVQMEVV
jgi:hypothetical protein